LIGGGRCPGERRLLAGIFLQRFVISSILDKSWSSITFAFLVQSRDFAATACWRNGRINREFLLRRAPSLFARGHALHRCLSPGSVKTRRLVARPCAKRASGLDEILGKRKFDMQLDLSRSNLIEEGAAI
jgi:hypothetical protein